MYGRIAGTGSALPEKAVTNEELAKTMDTSDEWIRARTGIQNRYVCRKEDVRDLAIRAARAALCDCGDEGDDIDLIIAATMSHTRRMPSLACEIQSAIGAREATAFDINGACTGFVHSLAAAQSYIHAGLARRVLIVGAEQLSSLVDWADRSTAVLFGDGAGAVILKADDHAEFSFVGKTFGEKSSSLTCGIRTGEREEDQPYIRMDGRAVFSFAVREVPALVTRLLVQAHVEKSDIAHYILHQANSRILDKVAQKLDIPIARFPQNLSEYGNTSAASIPLLIDTCRQRGVLRRGEKIVIAGFGGGLGAAAAYMTW